MSNVEVKRPINPLIALSDSTTGQDGNGFNNQMAQTPVPAIPSLRTLTSQFLAKSGNTQDEIHSGYIPSSTDNESINSAVRISSTTMKKISKTEKGLSEDLIPSTSTAQSVYEEVNLDDALLWLVVNEEPPSTVIVQSTDPIPYLHSSISTPFCRICFMGSDEGQLIRACHCRGTVGFVHHKCLLLWNFQRQSYSCEICHFSYNLRVKGLRWCWKWIYPMPRSQIATQILLFCMSWIVMIFSVASLLFIAFNLHSLFPDDVTAGVFIVMNSFTLLCSVGILLTQSLYPIRNMCQRFCLANLNIEILPFEESEISTTAIPTTAHDPNLIFLSSNEVTNTEGKIFSNETDSFSEKKLTDYSSE